MRYLDLERKLFTYEAEGGEHCFVRFDSLTLEPERPDFSARVGEKCIAEAAFTSAEDAAAAEWALVAAGGDCSLFATLEARGVPFRLPSGVRTATVTPFPAAASAPRPDQRLGTDADRFGEPGEAA